MIYSFDKYTLDTQNFELRNGSEVIDIEPQVFELLLLLIANAERVISQDEILERVWDGRIVSQSSLTSRINAARTAIGDTGAQQKYIRTVPRKGYRFIGKAHASNETPLPAPLALRGFSETVQEIRFCTSEDGTGIAYATSGSGPLLLKAANWMSHLEFEWQSPVWGHWIDNLSQRYRLVRYDGRGNGLSDRDASDVSLDAMVADLKAVTDVISAGPVPILAIGQGCATAIQFAIRHPDRVTQLILYGGYVKGWRARGDLREIAWRTALGTLIREGWAKNNAAFRQVFTSMFLPGGSPQQMEWYNELQRITADPETALRLHESFGGFDVTALLPKVRAPTLVIHAREDVVCPFNAGVALAAGIPGARFVPLESINHILLENETAFARCMEEIHAFARPERKLRAVENG